MWQRLGPVQAARPPWADLAETGLLIAAGVTAIFLMLKTRVYWAGLFVVLTAAAAFYGAWWLAATEGPALDALAPGAGLVLVFAVGGLMSLLQIHVLGEG